MYVCQNGHLEVLKYLVERGADVNTASIKGSTPLVHASQNGHLEVVEYLVEQGANVNTRDIDGSTPLMYVCQNGHLEVVKYLVERGADVNATSIKGSTPLIYASQKGHFKVVKFLVERGANNLNYALILASEKGSLQIVKYLIKQGANNLNNALIRASQNGHFKVVEFLVERGANNLGEALIRARSNRHLKVIEFLAERVNEEDSNNFSDIKSDADSILNENLSCTNVDVITMENYKTDSNDVFTIYYLNNQNQFTSNSCVSKSEMREYLKAEINTDPSLLTTIWKGGDETGVGGKPTLKFIIKLPPNNVWVTLGSFDKMMNSSIKNWYLLPLYGDKRRRIGYKYGMSANHGQIPGSKIYKAFTKEEILSGVICKESISDYPLYFTDFTIEKLSNGIDGSIVIETIKNHFL